MCCFSMCYTDHKTDVTFSQLMPPKKSIASHGPVFPLVAPFRAQLTPSLLPTDPVEFEESLAAFQLKLNVEGKLYKWGH